MSGKSPFVLANSRKKTQDTNIIPNKDYLYENDDNHENYTEIIKKYKLFEQLKLSSYGIQPKK